MPSGRAEYRSGKRGFRPDGKPKTVSRGDRRWFAEDTRRTAHRKTLRSAAPARRGRGRRPTVRRDRRAAARRQLVHLLRQRLQPTHAETRLAVQRIHRTLTKPGRQPQGVPERVLNGWFTPWRRQDRLPARIGSLHECRCEPSQRSAMGPVLSPIELAGTPALCRMVNSRFECVVSSRSRTCRPPLRVPDALPASSIGSGVWLC